MAFTGEPGTEKRLIAQSIHNAGLRREEPLWTSPLRRDRDELQLEMIFGEKGRSQGSGTLLLEGCGLADPGEPVPAVPADPLLRMGAGDAAFGGGRAGDGRSARGRCGSWPGRDGSGGFVLPSEGLTVRIPPLKERREDLTARIEAGCECCEHYSRYHVLTKGAMKF